MTDFARVWERSETQSVAKSEPRPHFAMEYHRGARANSSVLFGSAPQNQNKKRSLVNDYLEILLQNEGGVLKI